ncbi:MFS-type transporter SLC18B1 isoform X2 [Eurytemora carolleeae]|uniref:MFS-type transporter SLC18B1 isoform X2 n=1 Tax=Eurytemora carolleeae TaxID=1294199 RepID=UPI000C78CF07|nr:MFS-type transporter SLC18B1 isoform X2 [Eurytemora carolleeae]|eukprot:XP_023343269.1 MFS-type transporter SLC18B1-like isoform X2 [Eurytemora affinis]
MRARNILNLTLISGCLLLAGVSLSLMSPFYPTEALTKGVTVTQSGFVIGSVFISTILFTPICGKYIELLGARNFLLVGSFIVAIGNIAFGFLSEINNSKVFFWSSILIRVIIAIGESAMTPACYALASQQLGERHQGKAISLAEACFGVGTMFGPSIGGFLYQIGGFSLPFWIAGGVLFLINMSAIICLEDKSDMYTRLEEEEGITWKQVLCAPGVGVSLFGLAFAGSAWSWYSATLEPFLDSAYGLDPAQTGLVFTAFGATYTLFTPMFGFLADKGMNGISALILGNSIIGVGLLFLGPIPPFFGISGNLWLSVLSIGVQGLGSAATYLGSLLIMMKGVKDAGLPDTEQVKTMVSSLWIVADCAGGYAGSTLVRDVLYLI